MAKQLDGLDLVLLDVDGNPFPIQTTSTELVKAWRDRRDGKNAPKIVKPGPRTPCKLLGEQRVDADGKPVKEKCECKVTGWYPAFICEHVARIVPEHVNSRGKLIERRPGWCFPTLLTDSRTRGDLGRYMPCQFCHLYEQRPEVRGQR